MTRLQLLQTIISTSQKLKSCLAARQSGTDIPPQVLNVYINIPPLRLEDQMAIFQAKLNNSGLLPQISHLASQKAKELALQYQQSYQRLCKDLASSHRNQGPPLDNMLLRLRTTFESLYEKRDLASFLVSAQKAQREYSLKVKSLPSKPSRPAFNHECTPLLEAYFTANAYPSMADRLTLATKTFMTPRQIEVWFQNHRNRAKKEGRPIQRGASSSALQRALASAAHASPNPLLIDGTSPAGCLISDDESTHDMESVCSVSQCPSDGHQEPRASFSLNDTNSRPPHAFPTRYPLKCVEDPFPNKSGVFTFSPPVWRRHPQTSQNRPTPPIELDELSAIFASKLTIRDFQPTAQRNGSATPWFASRVTRPAPAPLRALKRPCKPLQRPSFVSPNSNQISSRTAPLVTNAFPNCRKSTVFPKRLPSTFCHWPLSLSPSRVLSEDLSSYSASQSRSTSLSSASSDVPVTPPPTDFGHTFVSENDLQIFDDLFDFELMQDTTSQGDVLSFRKAHTFPTLNAPSRFVPPSLSLIYAQS